MLSQQNVDTINAPHQLPVLMLPQSPDQGALRALWSDGSSVTNELADRAGTAAEIAGGVETGADIVMIGTGTGGLIKGGMTVVKAGGKRALVKYGTNVGKTFAVGAGAAWGIGAIGERAGMSPEQIELAQRGIATISAVKALRFGKRVEGQQFANSELPLGAARRLKFGHNWSTASLDKALERHLSGKYTTWQTSTRKMIYENPSTGRQIVVDLDGDYFRIFQPKRIGSMKGNYLDMMGQIMPNTDKGQMMSHFLIE